MECYICRKRLEKGYLCKKHCNELKEMLDRKENIIENPTFAHHCLICGEFEDRIIIEYPSVGPFCNKDLEDEIIEE